jgi:hypothetical protein
VFVNHYKLDAKGHPIVNGTHTNGNDEEEKGISDDEDEDEIDPDKDEEEDNQQYTNRYTVDFIADYKDTKDDLVVHWGLA